MKRRDFLLNAAAIGVTSAFGRRALAQQIPFNFLQRRQQTFVPVSVGSTNVPATGLVSTTGTDQSLRNATVKAIRTCNLAGAAGRGVLIWCDDNYANENDDSSTGLNYSPEVLVVFGSSMAVSVIVGGGGGSARTGDDGNGGGGGGLAISSFNAIGGQSFSVFAGSRGYNTNFYNYRAGGGSAVVVNSTTVCYATGGAGSGAAGQGVTGTILRTGGVGQAGGTFLNGSAGGAAGPSGDGAAGTGGGAAPGFGGSAGAISPPYDLVITETPPDHSFDTDAAGGLGGGLVIDGNGDSGRGAFGGGGASTQGGSMHGGAGFVWLYW